MATRRNIKAEDNNLSDKGYYNLRMLEALEWKYNSTICRGGHLFTRKSLTALMKEVPWVKDERGKDIELDIQSRFYEVMSVY